ncbi:MAG TPA: extracellular solute-binding protein [Acidimicrobiales bacterium]
MTRRQKRWQGASLAALVAVAALSACGGGGDDGDDEGGGLEDPGDCVAVDLASSPEKIELMEELADDFNGSDAAELDDGCAFVRVHLKSSGLAESLLANGWDESTEGPRPVIWSPAASTWGALLNQHTGSEMADLEARQFMLSPLVIAMPRPMAEALGYPDTPIGFADILALTRDPQGWGGKGHPEWGQFRLGKTNPNFSTSGLAALIAQAYAATGKTSGLSSEDLDNPTVVQFATDVESSVVHYGDTTLTFLNNWYRADMRGNALQYVSAAAVEEKSVIDYNTGNPDGIVEPGEEAREPREQLVAIYPKEGTLYSNHPLFVLDADWVSAEEREAADLFVEYAFAAENQEKVLRYGFRPGNPDVPVGDPISEENGVNPATPETLLEVPQPAVLARLLDDWSVQRKSARVLLLIDVSGSMGDPGDPETGQTKLDLAKSAAVEALNMFKDDDEVGLWIFSTELGPEADQNILELQAPARVGDVREQLANRIRELAPVANTPLYEATEEAFRSARENYDPTRINAVVVLSDGQNQDGDGTDDGDQLDALLTSLSSSSEGQSTPVRVFPIGYGEDADQSTLRQIADATSAAAYDASDPTTIDRVLDAVISNF